MNGMSFEQYKEILNFINIHHKSVTAGYMKPENRIIVNNKWFTTGVVYVDSSIDFRDGQIFSIQLRPIGLSFYTGINALSNSVDFDNLYDWIMEFLKGNWIPNKEQYKLIKINGK